MHHEIPRKPWEVVGADMFTLHNKIYLGIVDPHRKFSIIKKMEDLPRDSLILACEIIFSEYGLPRKIMSNAGGNFISEKNEKFCRRLHIECAALSSYHHQSNGQVEVCIKLVKQTMKKCHDTKSDIHLALLHVKTMPLGPGLPSPASLLLNYHTRDIIPLINRPPISIDDDEHHRLLVKRQAKNDKKYLL